MNVKKNIIQFTPYYSPHIGGVEKVVEGIFGKWTHGKSSINSGNKGQQGIVYNERLNNSEIFFGPGFDIVDNFWIPGLWTKKFWKNLSSHKKSIEKETKTYVITHTRFFLTSFIGGVFTKRLQGHRVKWIHIEHGSDYVQLSSNLKNKIAYLYDRTLGKWVLKNADVVLGISEASRDFVQKEFGRKDTEVWYRGIDVPKKEYQKQGGVVFVYVGRLVSLKGVDDLIHSFSELSEGKLMIIGDGPEREYLEQLSVDVGVHDRIEFLGNREGEEVIEILSKRNGILVNPSYQEGMPTTVIEGLMTKNVVVATDVGGTGEISTHKDLLLYRAGDRKELSQAMKKAQKNYSTLQGKSYTHIRDTFSWEKSIQELYEII